MGSFMRSASFVFYVALFLISTFHNCLCNRSSNTVCFETEKQALLKFKQDLKDPSNRLSSWAGEDCCQWAGVVCDNLTGHVREIHLRSNLLSQYFLSEATCERYLHSLLGGKINPSLLDLKHLRYLDLSYNNFEGVHIPSFIGSIGSLRYLNLSGTGLGGTIPHQLGNLTMLRFLDLSGTELGGTIPHQLGNLTMLRYLGLGRGFSYYYDLELRGDNLQWLSGLLSLQQLDIRVANLSKASNWLQVINTLPSLVELHLSTCELQLVSPSININFTPLAILDLSDNYCWPSIPIPKWIFSMSHLVSLDISGCYFHGPIPSGIQNMTSLRVFDASLNSLNSMSEGLFKLSGLISLGLCHNNFQGPIPIGLLNMTSLRDLHLYHNGFSSKFPNWLCSLNCLESIDLSDNLLQGAISSAIGNLTSLVNLYLSFNQLDGKIPTSVGQLCKLKEIDLSSNKFDGEVGEVFKSFSRCKSNALETMVLENNNLGGQLPNEIDQFKNLTYLYLESNSFSGPIPVSIGRLSSLTRLDISNNHLNGTLPESLFDQLQDELGQFKNLATLSLSNNSISGPIPVSIGRLSSLVELNLSYNHLNGTLPESLWQLGKLEMLDISHNFMNGIVSDIHFANLMTLRNLDGSGNNLTLKVRDDWIPSFQLRYLMLASWQLGPQFPSWLQFQGHLIALNIANTGISDSIPQWFWPKSSNLYLLNLSHNQIRGEIPSIPEVFGPYSTIDLSSNYFKGPLPLISSNVSVLDLSNNSFSGSIDHALCGRMDMLYCLKLGNNNLSGRIPDCWKHLRYLNILNLENNNWIGTIPHSIGHLASLQSLHLRHNKLSGELPQSLQHCTKLELVDLDGNEFIGSIPTWMGNSFPQLIVLNLRSNKFQGGIPYELCHLNSLQILDLAHNNLSGHVPKCFNNFTSMIEKQNSSNDISYYANSPQPQSSENAFLVTKGREFEYSTTLKLVTSMDLSENNLSGQIPKGLTRLVGLRSLNLSGNHFTGRIPENIGDMKQLESLDFSLNQLGGEIPLSMSSLTFLSHLNLSHNNLKGRIPSSTQLQSFENSSFVGNKLCGPPLADCDTNKAIAKVGHGGNEGEEFPKVWFFAISALGFVVGFWVVVGPLLFKRSWRIAYFRFLDGIGYGFCNFYFKVRYMFGN